MPVLTSEEFYGKSAEATANHIKPPKNEAGEQSPVSPLNSGVVYVIMELPFASKDCNSVCAFWYKGEEIKQPLERGRVKVKASEHERIQMLKGAGFMIIEQVFDEDKEEPKKEKKSKKYRLMHPDHSESAPINVTIENDGKKYDIINSIVEVEGKREKEYFEKQGYVIISARGE